MLVTLRSEGLQSLEQIKAFLEGIAALGFEPPGLEAVYDLLATELHRFGYARLGKTYKCLMGQHRAKVTDLSKSKKSGTKIPARKSENR